MEFGLYLDTQAPDGTPATSLAANTVAQARTAREAGFDLLSAGQHYLSDYVQLQTVPTLARLAAEAEGMTLATGVILLPLHHPVEIAEQVATIDAFADEVVVGVGEGYRDAEFDAFGVPKRERAGRLAEGIELMNRLWTESGVTYDGEFYAVSEATINPRPATKPDVWVAANAPVAIERAARLGDAWFVNPMATVADLREQKPRYDEVRRERGLDTGVPILREAFVADSREAAIETAGEYIAGKYQKYLDWGQGEAGPAPSGDSIEELAEDRFLLGTPEEVCAELERYADLGVTRAVVRSSWPGFPTDAARRSIERLGDEVLPYV